MNNRLYLLNNYNTPPFSVERGEGSYLFDTDGKRYLDFTSGIAVSACGHAHPQWVKAVSAQAARLVHCSNLFDIPEQGRLAHRLVDQAGPGKVLFCNSGAEANEALIKLARLHGRKLAGGVEGERFHVVCAENGFHGRTFGGMSATPQEKIQGGFRPMLEGFKFARLNDIDSFAAAINAQTAAVMVETIQGEGGIYPSTPEFLRALRALCDEHGILMILDEVQCGIGRSGHFFAYQEAGIRPDAIGMAKGLGGGFPIGAIWVAGEHADLFTPGSHGTTFGGSPLACAAAHAILDILEGEQLLNKIRTRSQHWHQALHALVERHPAQLSGMRGRGYMVALVVQGNPADWVAQLRRNGLLCVPAGNQAVRLLPPLTATEDELESCIQIIDATLKQMG